MNKKLVIALVPILVVIIAVLGVLGFLLVAEEDNVYLEQMQIAQKHIENGDYESAILYYRSAIEADITQEEPYLLLAEVYYVGFNDLENALAVLEEGYANTGSAKIQSALINYQVLSGVPEAEIKEMPTNFGALNTSLVDLFSTYTYQTYCERMTVKTEKKSNGVYTVSYAQYDIDFEYKNSSDNSNIIDSNTGLPYSYARPTSIRVNDLSILISGVDQGVGVNELKSNGVSSPKVNKSNKTVGSEFITFEYAMCQFTIACDSNGAILSADCYNSIVPPKGENSTQKVTVMGRIIDVTSGQPVNGTTLTFREGSNNETGNAKETCSATNGSYSVELEPDTYTVEVSADGYTTEYFELIVPQTSSITQDFSISSVLGASQIRIVLEWGTMPEDLDSHLEGTTSDGRGINIDFTNKSASTANGEIANLDIDDRSGYGPETITLNDTRGSYTYSVHKFSGSGTLASSGATVKVYTGDSSHPIVISVPSDVSGDWWEVFRIENGRVVDINGVT